MPPLPPSLLASTFVAASLAAQAGTWTALPSQPPVLTGVIRSFAGLAHDPARQRTVLFGHVDQPALQTWEHDGTTWSLRSSLPVYGGTNWSNLVYDEVRGRVLMVTTAFNIANIATWDGQSWQAVAMPGPVGGGQLQIERDPLHDTVVMLGASPAGTWIWNGSTWQRFASVPPAGSIAFDPVRGEVLCAAATTWSWDGVAWRDLGAPTPGGIGIVTDPSLGRVLGMDGADDLWEWRGFAWNREVDAGSVHPMSGLLAFDATHGGVVCCAPFANGGMWVFHELPATTASFQVLGTGCTGPLGVPVLVPVGGARPRLGHAFPLLLANVPDSPLNLAFGVIGSSSMTWSGGALPFELGAIGAPGCWLRIDPEVVVPLVLQNQTATWDLAIPAAAAFAGTAFCVQAAIVVPGWNMANLVVSDAGQGVVGSR
jgi:hypothetical protein